ncbi:MAG: hypothetical protein FWC39_05785 [Bacteroidetes bacterium]|nr:hypothetical protein [Bacteroidota bacterium]
MKYILSIIFVFISLLTYSQQDTVFFKYNIADYDEPVSYTTDTIIFYDRPFTKDRDMLIGTTVLPWTSGQMNARSFGISFFKSITSEPCKTSGEEAYRMKDEIISVVETENELIVSIKISANCCHTFLGDVDVFDENTINLITHGYGSWCACMCCFGLTFHFDTMKEWGDYSKLEYIIINGREETRRKIR